MGEHTARRPAGYALWATPDGDLTERDTLQCCHCGAHWFVVPGSGRRRGFCTGCNKVTCGAPACMACRPQERQLEEAERLGQKYANWRETFRR